MSGAHGTHLAPDSISMHVKTGASAPSAQAQARSRDVDQSALRFATQILVVDNRALLDQDKLTWSAISLPAKKVQSVHGILRPLQTLQCRNPPKRKGTATLTYNPLEVELVFPVSHWMKRY